MEWRDRIIVDPTVLVGKPVLKGTRLAVEFVVDLLANGDKPERFRLGRTDNWWSSKGRTKSELNV